MLMAAYVSLMDLIQQIEKHHHDPPLSLDHEQAKSLTDKISSLQRFLEDFHSRGFIQEIQALESRIADVAHAAEDVIESHTLLMAAYEARVSLIEQIKHHPKEEHVQSLREKVTFLRRFLEAYCDISLEIQSRTEDAVRAAEAVIESHVSFSSDDDDDDDISEDEADGVDQQVLFASVSTTDENVAEKKAYSTDLYDGLQRVIKDIKLIEEQALVMEKRLTFQDHNKLPPRRSLLPPLGSSNTTTMVGFDHIRIKVMERLTRSQSRKLHVVPIAGMGGAGKTVLARNIYENKLIAEHFHMRSWLTISQEYVVREVLIEILLHLSNQKSREALSRDSEEDLGVQLHQSLFDRKYLIVLDDVWTIEAWDKLKLFFPDNNNGSSIMITTRLSKLAFHLTGSHSDVVNMDPLDEDTSWDLLCKKVLADNICPLELEEIGKKIASNCRGLPLSIVTIGGLLSKSGMTRDYWEYVAKNVSSLVNSEEDEHCLSILSLSYIHLPVHLKPCFLYMGLFPEDERIRASHLIRLWVAEGFLKPIDGKSLEVVGEDYLEDLVERNLVLVHRWGSTGKIKYCVIHDLLRDLCLREAHKEKFLFVVGTDNLEHLQGSGISNMQRRIAIHCSTLIEEDSSHHETPYSALFLRTCIIGSEKVMKLISLKSIQHLRISAGVERNRGCDIVPLVNSRFLCLNGAGISSLRSIGISSLRSVSWSLQTLILDKLWSTTSTIDIWKMPQLRHVKIKGITMSGTPPPSSVDGVRPLVLENLQTLWMIRDFNWSEEAVKKIPNIKKLGIYCSTLGWFKISRDSLNNLERLQNLQSIKITFDMYDRNQDWWFRLRLPISLRKLTLSFANLDNRVMSTMIGGSLPHLEVLKLIDCDLIGGDGEWNPVEGQFCRLKYLELYNYKNLKYWNNADHAHFPCLEHLRIIYASYLEEFPWGIGDIPTLRLIELDSVRDAHIISAKRMLEEQEDQLGNVTLVVHVLCSRKAQKERLENLASNNFKINHS